MDAPDRFPCLTPGLWRRIRFRKILLKSVLAAFLFGPDARAAEAGATPDEPILLGPSGEEEPAAPAEGPAAAPSEPEPAAAPAPAPAPEATTVWVIGSEQNLLRMSGTGAIVSGEEFRAQSYDDVNQVLRRVPGVYLRQEDGFGLFPNISLRGVDGARSAKVTLLEDGVLTAPAPYSAPSAYYSPTMGRMFAIEVLKGSSQVRYGPHTTGGVIQYVSTPIPTRRQVSLRTLYGSQNEIRTHAWIGDTVDTESAWGRVGFVAEGWYRQSDGYKRIDAAPDFTDVDRTGIRSVEPMLKLSWEPRLAVPNRFEVKLGYTRRDADETYLGLAEGDFRSDPYRRYSSTRFDSIGMEHYRSYVRHVIEPAEETTITSTVYASRFSRDWFKLNDVTDAAGDRTSLSRALAAGGSHLATLRGEAAGTLRVRHNNRDYDLWGIESVARRKLDLGTVTHEVFAGIRFHRDTEDRDQLDESFTQSAGGAITDRSVGPPGGAGDRVQRSSALSFFVEDAIEIGRWTITPGFRYEHVDQSFRDLQSGESGEGNQDLLAGGLGVVYAQDEDLSWFGGVYRGHSVPSPRSAIRDGLDEETSVGFEIGPKYYPESGWIGLEGAFFYTWFDDLIVVDNLGGAGLAEPTENAGEVGSCGIELSARVDPGLALDWPLRNPWWLAFTWTEATFLGTSPSADPESIFAGAKAGNRVPYVPRFSLGFGTGLEWDRYGLFLGGYWVDEMFTSASNTDRQVSPAGTPDARFGTTDSYVLLDVSGHVRFTDEVKLFAGVQNLLGEEYVASRHPHGPRPGPPLFAYAGLEIDW